MATSVGTLYCRGKRTRQAYIVDVYCVDAASDFDHFASGGVGASTATPEEISFPEDMVIEHYYQVAATTAVRRQFCFNGNATGNIMRCSVHTPSATNIQNPYIGLVVPAGVKLSLATLA